MSETDAEQDLSEIAEIGRTTGGDLFVLDDYPGFTCGGSGEPGARYVLRSADEQLFTDLVEAYQDAGWVVDQSTASGAPDGTSLPPDDDVERLKRRESGYDTVIAVQRRSSDEEIRVTAVISKSVCSGD